MKHGWKVFWSICAVLGCLGVGFAVAGCAMGANTETILKAYDGELESSRIYTDQIFHKYDDTEYDHFDAIGTAYSSVSELDVSASECQVIVENASVDDVTVDSSELKGNFTIEQDINQLKIDTDDSGIGHNGKGKLYIYVPTGYVFQKVNFEVGAGTLSVEELNADKVSLEVGAGHAKVLDCATIDLDVECGAGQVEVGLAGAQSDYNHDMECGVGVIKLGDDSFSGIAVDKKINNNADKNTNIDCGMGEVDLTFLSQM